MTSPCCEEAILLVGTGEYWKRRDAVALSCQIRKAIGRDLHLEENTMNIVQTIVL